jgi:hypothetical protein
MVCHSQPERPRIEKAPDPIPPQRTHYDGRESVGEEEHKGQEIAVLPLDERIVP